MKPVNMPPDAATLMWSTRAIGYTTPAAIADIIDNSIYAKASEIQIEYFPGEDAYISILDNGTGMSATELKKAMKYGSGDPLRERSDSDLGRFGLGLKTASLSQCRKLTVISKKNTKISAYSWDLDYIFKVRKWDLLELGMREIKDVPQLSKLKECSEGTIVLWNNLDKLSAGDSDKESGLIRKMQEVEDHLALTFHRYLQGEPGIEKIRIRVNGIQIEPQDPFYISKSDVLPTESISVKYNLPDGTVKKALVTITPYILPFSDSISQEELDKLGGKEGLVKNQGFYIYRNKRLIVPANWFRLTRKTDLSKLCRVKVDIPNTLDDLWTIDVKKSMAIPPENVLRDLKRIVSPTVLAGQRKYRFRSLKPKSINDSLPLWMAGETRNGVIYSINQDYPLLKEVMKECGNPKKLQILIKLIEQNIPVNSIHTDFNDDKKYAFEDVDEALNNIKQNIRDLLEDVPDEDREAAFAEIMSVMPFAEYDLKFSEIGDI